MPEAVPGASVKRSGEIGLEKRHAAALLLAVLLSFPGCSAVLERSYDVVEPHNSQY